MQPKQSVIVLETVSYCANIGRTKLVEAKVSMKQRLVLLEGATPLPSGAGTFKVLCV